jgi:hypothetical protein
MGRQNGAFNCPRGPARIGNEKWDEQVRIADAFAARQTVMAFSRRLQLRVGFNVIHVP